MRHACREMRNTYKTVVGGPQRKYNVGESVLDQW